jgi:DNA repair photolyase
MTLLRETQARSILTRSKIPGVDYCINPYTGCLHACRYCYADFMKRFTGHTGRWGSFVDVKVNAPLLLKRELGRKRPGTVMISSVTDPYQPVEKKYRLTRKCLEILIPHRFPVQVLTKSPLVLRDIDLFKRFDHIEVGITITTDDDGMRKAFEPGAPPIVGRIDALRKLHAGGVRTYAFIGPTLPMNPEALAETLAPHVDSILIDRMNYVSKTVSIYRSLNLSRWLDEEVIGEVIQRLRYGFDGIPTTLS